MVPRHPLLPRRGWPRSMPCAASTCSGSPAAARSSWPLVTAAQMPVARLGSTAVPARALGRLSFHRPDLPAVPVHDRGIDPLCVCQAARAGRPPLAALRPHLPAGCHSLYARHDDLGKLADLRRREVPDLQRLADAGARLHGRRGDFSELPLAVADRRYRADAGYILGPAGVRSLPRPRYRRGQRRIAMSATGSTTGSWETGRASSVWVGFWGSSGMRRRPCWASSPASCCVRRRASGAKCFGWSGWAFFVFWAACFGAAGSPSGFLGLNFLARIGAAGRFGARSSRTAGRVRMPCTPADGATCCWPCSTW